MNNATLATMKGSPRSERELLDLISRTLPKPASDVLTGIGDDCAVIRRPVTQGILELLKTDALVEGVHFASGTRLDQVGWKALCRPISDIAAMGGNPKNAVITVAAPSSWGNAEWRALYRGIGKAAHRFGISIVGGETVRSPGSLFLSVALTGSVPQKHLRLRSGGTPGDVMCVTGKLGGSLESGRHLRFLPRVEEGAWLAKQSGVSAMMDLSDGIGSDLPKLASASGVSFLIDPGLLPRHRGCSIDQALSDGEDYELLCCIRLSDWEKIRKDWKETFHPLPLTCIGELIPGGMQSTRLAPGFDHLHS